MLRSGPLWRLVCCGKALGSPGAGVLADAGEGRDKGTLAWVACTWSVCCVHG